MTTTKSFYILFDAVGVLIHPEPSPEIVLQETLKEKGIQVTSRALSRAIAIADATFSPEYRKPFVEMSNSEINDYWIAYNSVILRSISNLDSKSEREIAGAISDDIEKRLTFEAYPDVPEALEQAKVLSNGLGVVSNWELKDVSLSSVLKSLELFNFFNTIVASNEVGVEKPNTKIFNLALENLGAKAQQSLYVGDSIDIDVKGAQKAGLKPILLSRSSKPCFPEQFTDLLTIDSLLSLIPLVEEIIS